MAKQNGNDVTGLGSEDAECKEEKCLLKDADNVKKETKVQDESSAPAVIDISDESSSETLSGDCNSDSSTELEEVTVTVTTISHKSSHRKKIKKKKVTTIKTQCRVDRSIKSKKDILSRAAEVNAKSAGAGKASSLIREGIKRITEQNKNWRQAEVKNEKSQPGPSTIDKNLKPFTDIKDSNLIDEINAPQNSKTSENPGRIDIEEKFNVRNANVEESSSSLREERKKSTDQDKNQRQAPLKHQTAQDPQINAEKHSNPVTKVEAPYLVEEMEEEENCSLLENRGKNDNRVEISELSGCEICTIDEEESIDMNISSSSEIVTPESIKIFKEEKKYSQLGVANFSDTNNRGCVKSQLFADNLETGCRRKIEFNGKEAEDRCDEFEETRGDLSANCQDIIVLSDSDDEDNSWYKSSLQNQSLREKDKNSNKNPPEKKKIEEIHRKDYAKISRQKSPTKAIECNNNYEESDFNKPAEKRNVTASRPRFAVQENGVCRDLVREGYYRNVSVVKPASGKFLNTEKSVDNLVKKEKNTFDDERDHDQQESAKEKETSDKKSHKRLHNDASTSEERNGEKRACTEKKSVAHDRFNGGEKLSDGKRVDVERWLYDNRYYEENLAFNDTPDDDENRRHEGTTMRVKKSGVGEKRPGKIKSHAGRGQRRRIRAQLEERLREEREAADVKRTANDNRFPQKNRSADDKQIANDNRFSEETRIAHENRTANNSQIPKNNLPDVEKPIVNENQFASENRSAMKNQTPDESRFPKENRPSMKNQTADETAEINNSSDMGTSEQIKPIKGEKKYSEFGVMNFSNSANGSFVTSQLFGANSDIKSRHKMELKDAEVEGSIEEIEESIEEIEEVEDIMEEIKEVEDIIVLSDSEEEDLSYKRSLQTELFGKNRQKFTEISTDRQKVAVEYKKDDTQLSTKLSIEYNNNDENQDFNERRGEEVQNLNSSVSRPRFVIEKNGKCIDLVRTGRNWWNKFLSEPVVDRKIKRKKRFAGVNRAHDQRESKDEKISYKRPHDGLADERKSVDEKRARIETKSRDEDYCKKDEEAHEKKDVDEKHRDEKEFLKGKRSCDEDRSNEFAISCDRERIELERLLGDESDFHENRSFNDKRADEDERRHEGTRERDEKIIRELERIHDEKIEREENGVHGEKRLRDEKPSAGENRPDQEKRFSGEKRPSGENRFSEMRQSDKKIPVFEENRSFKERQSAEENGSFKERQSAKEKRPDKERRSSEEKRPDKERRLSEEKRPDKERRFSEEKCPDKERHLSEEKRPDKERRLSEEKCLDRQSSDQKTSEERQYSREQWPAKKRRFSEENQHATEKRPSKENHFREEKRFFKEKSSTEEKRSLENEKSAEKKRSAEEKRAAEGRSSPEEEPFRGFDFHWDEHRAFDTRRESDHCRFSEEKRSDHVDMKSPHRISVNDREIVENKENRAKSHKHDEEHENRQRKPANLSDKNEIPKRDKILKDPRLKPNSHPIVLIRKLGQIKKPVPIVQPPFLPKGDRRASCSNIVNMNKSVDKEEANAASPSTSQSSQFTARESPKNKEEEKKNRPEKSSPKLSKRDLARKATIERKIYVRDQKWRRIKHPWANTLPISKKPPQLLSSEAKQQIKAMRRIQLREIAEQHKNPASEKSATIPAAVSEADDESLAKCVAAQSAKVTEEPRGYFLFSKPLEQRTQKKTGKFKRSSMGKKSERKINSRSSNEDDEAIDNSDESENEDEDQNVETQNSDDMETAENFPTKAKIEQSETGKLKQRKSLVTETPKVSGFSKVVKHVFFDDSATEIHEFEIEPGHKMRKFDPKDIARWQKATKNIDDNRQSTTDAAVNKIYPKIEEFLAHIFHWNPRWLEEQIEIKAPPPIVDENKLTAMLSCYRSYEEYYKIAEPLLTLEMWYGISKDFEEGKTRLNFFSIVSNSINVIPIYFTNVQVSTLILEVVVSRQDLQLQAHPVYGDLLFFEYHSNRKDERGYASWEVFAYVTSLRKTPITSLTNLNRDLINAVKEPHTLLTYTVMTKALDDTDVQTNRVNRLRTISYLRSNMRPVQALQNLPKCPLMDIILHPKVVDYQLPAVNNVEAYPLVTKDSLNTKQLEAVVKITNAVVQKLPKVCLIQGPPGTGKSKVIVNLVTQILYGDDRYHSFKKLRILVCAPSNAAVDEIVLRLLNVRKSFDEENRFNIVRTGRTETIHPSAKIVSLREQAKKRVEEKSNSYPSTSISGHQYECESKERRNLAKMYREAEEELLKEADVIASTLTSCYTNQMELIFGENAESISVCIVDEATQSAEPENLIPLMLGVRTLVLVGDTNQLPATVLSQKAKQFGLDQSLFARIWRVFEGEANNPIIQLNTQYRMTIPVSHFPNKYFYAGALTNAAKMNKLPFHFYRVINLDSTQDITKFSNVHEADFVANLVYTMIARTNYYNAVLPVKVGIITPYNSQKYLLRRRIKERVSRLKDKDRIVYEVNTVDSFQGQERDVIIMSCVRSSGIGFLSDRQRLCVALTRAKHSLILCGNFRTFHRDPMWKALLSDAQTRNVYINVKSNSNPGDIRSHIIR